MPNKQQRPVDITAKETMSWWDKSFVFIKKTEIKAWQAIFITAFVAGIATALIWAVSTEKHQSSRAALDCPGPYHVLKANNRCVWSCAAGTIPNNASNECVCKEGYIETGKDQLGRRICQDMKIVPYRLKIGRLFSGASSYNGAYPNFNKGYTHIHFIALSKNPTYSAGIFQSSNGGPHFSNSNDNGNNEPLKLAWTNAGLFYGEGELTIEGEASITVDFDGDPITIYLPTDQPWKRTNFLGYTDLPDGTRQHNYDATYLYVAADGSTYWDEKLTQLARPAPTKIKCYDTDAGKNYYMKGNILGYKYGSSTTTKASFVDKCNSTTSIKEYYCKLYPGGDRYIEEVNISCASGCYNGSCVLRDYSNISCLDTDNGIDYYNKGTTTSGNISISDECKGNQIIETFCQNENGLLSAYSSITDGEANGSANITLEIRGKTDDSPTLMGNFRRYITIFYASGKSDSWSDSEYFDPANYILVMAHRNTNWIGTLPQSAFNMKVDGKIITIYLPSITYTDMNGVGYVSFYIAKDGSTYYAKRDHLNSPGNYGTDEWLGSVDLSPTEAFRPEHLARASLKLGKAKFNCLNGCTDGACLEPSSFVTDKE